jgi:hypothetical protein
VIVGVGSLVAVGSGAMTIGGGAASTDTVGSDSGVGRGAFSAQATNKIRVMAAKRRNLFRVIMTSVKEFKPIIPLEAE